MSILVLQHSAVSGPGRLGVTLRDHGFRLDIRRLDLDGAAALPPDLDDVQGILSLGGPQNVTDQPPAPFMEAELELLRAAHAQQLPVIGICLGAQLIAHALGGTVAPMVDDSGGPRVEWGFHPIALNPVGQIETMLAGIAWNAHHFCAHGQEVKQVPPESTLLASSKQCKVQIYRAGLRTYGFQHHFECDLSMIEALLAESSASLAKAGLSSSEVMQQAERHYPTFSRLSDRLCVNLATYLFPLHHRLAG
jgi:GMP synthase (glutamine-hydrolysing)